jgi:uncharacterized protein YegJ (DUF2314 family)
MWPFLDRPAAHPGVVFYRGPIAPPVDQVLGLASAAIGAARVEVPPGVDSPWAVRLTHPAWGEALVTAPREAEMPDEDVRRWGTFGLTDAERGLLSRAEVALVVHVTTPERSVLRARKQLLRWLHLLTTLDGLAARDDSAGLFWSPAMLDDELAHDADLDVEALYTIHAVYDEDAEARTVFWLHTHGLEELGAFDVDILRPSPDLASHPADPMRALAFAALEGVITPSTTGFALGHPDGTVDFVPAETFDRAAAADARLRTPDGWHHGRRAVVCEPRGLFGFLRRTPVPSRFLSSLSGDIVFNFTKSATALMAARARTTLPVLRLLMAEFAGSDLPTAVKIGYPTDGDPSTREHLWFEVHAIESDRIDATLVNQPFDVAALCEGARGWHAIADVSDWMMLSPAGAMTPRNLSAARRLRESGWPSGPYAERMRESA